MNILIKNRRLVTTILIISVIGIGFGLNAIMTFNKSLYFLIPMFFVCALFSEWLRGLEKAKNIKYFMIFRMILVVTILTITFIYFSLIESSLYNFGFVLMIISTAISLVADFIENKYFIKKETPDTES